MAKARGFQRLRRFLRRFSLMPGTCRLTDIHFNPSDCHGCPNCCHPVSGPAITGSSDVYINSLPALRCDHMDMGVHCCCCGPNIWGTLVGSPDVIVNCHGIVRLNDVDWCCGGVGTMVTCSQDVIANG